jgi:hypothetical protein
MRVYCHQLGYSDLVTKALRSQEPIRKESEVILGAAMIDESRDNGVQKQITTAF